MFISLPRLFVIQGQVCKSVDQFLHHSSIDCQWQIVIYSFQCLLWTDLVGCHDRVAEYIIIALVDLVPFSYRLH